MTPEELAEEQKEPVMLGDECQIILPEQSVDCTALGFFDTLENDCWELVKKYCEKLGVKMLPNEEGNVPVSFDIAKGIQDQILDKLQDAGVEMQFEHPEPKMQM